MPTYSFRDKRTDAEFDKMMMIAELDTYLDENPHLEQVITSGTKIVHERGTNFKVDDGFREVISKVKETYTVNNLKSY